MLITLLVIIYLLPIIGYIFYRGYKHQNIDISIFLWPCLLPLLPFISIFVIGRIVYLLGEWVDAPLSMNFWKYLLKYFFNE